MAAIDKTYTTSWNEYQTLIKWAKETTFTCPDGTKLKPIDYVYSHWAKEDFDIMGRPVMNTSYVCDYYLIKYCPLDFVQKRMTEVYDEEYVKSIKNGTSEFDTFKKEGKYGTKFRLIKQPKKGMRGNKPFKYKYWFVQLREPDNVDLDYNESENRWIWDNELTALNGWSSNTCHRFKTRRALERNIRKWKLPIGTIVRVHGRYIFDKYEYLVY